MNHACLRKFSSMDKGSFTALMNHLGFSAAACYRLQNRKMSLVIASDDSSTENWPAIVQFNNNYTPNLPSGVPLGWVKPSFDSTTRKLWPKGSNFYYADQELFSAKFVLVVKKSKGKRCQAGRLHGELEAIIARIRNWVDQSELRFFINEASFSQHVKTLGGDLQKTIDHELRTPLSSINGYLTFLTDPSLDCTEEETAEYNKIISTQMDNVLETIDKLSFALTSATHYDDEIDKPRIIDIKTIISDICRDFKSNIMKFIDDETAENSSISYTCETDLHCETSCSPRLLRLALFEVIKNAVSYSKNNAVRITLSQTDNSAIIDIEDDGNGITEGAEELVFLKFFQEPSAQLARKGKRGLGLGLFLARYITERHMGQLQFVRNKTKGGVFRFIWPLSEENIQDNENISA